MMVPGLLAGCVLFANAFAIYYVTQEETIYVWDHSIYWFSFQDLTTLIKQDPLHVLRSVVVSVNRDDYNLLPAFVLIPFGLVFGTSRLSYVLAIVNIYLLPAVFLMGLVANRIYDRRSPVVLVITVLTALAFHPIWMPALSGMVGIAGIVVIGAFLLVYVARPFEEQTTRNVLLMALLLCLLVLVRRWYAFWVVAFFAALAIVQLALLAIRHRSTWRQHLGAIRNGLILVASFSIVLFCVGTAFMVRVLLTDYSDVYAGYRTTDSWLGNALALIAYLGPLTTLGWLAGSTWLVLHKPTRPFGTLLSLHAIFVVVLFWRTQDFGFHHYYLLAPSVILGIATPLAHVYLNADRVWYRAAAVGATLAILLMGTTAVMLPAIKPVAESFWFLLPGEHRYPQVRTDLETLDRILSDLERRHASTQGSTYILASSGILNSNLLANACRQRHGSPPFCESILRTHDVDRRDGFPLQFLAARYILLGVPTQYHLTPEHQRVVGILADKIRSGRGIGTAFRRLPEQYQLDDGVRVWLFERVRPFPEADLRGLEAEFLRYYPESANLFTIREDVVDHDRYCWVKSKLPWLYALIQRFRQNPAVSCPSE